MYSCSLIAELTPESTATFAVLEAKKTSVLVPGADLVNLYNTGAPKASSQTVVCLN